MGAIPSVGTVPPKLRVGWGLKRACGSEMPLRDQGRALIPQQRRRERQTPH